MDYFAPLVEGIKYALPAAVTGYTTYYFLNRFFRYEEKKQILLAKKDLKKHSLPLRLQAYERLAVFLERISPVKLTQNVIPQSEDKLNYERALVYQIESEYEHNLSQQIYVSNQCWEMLTNAKNATMLFIRQTSEKENVQTASDLQEALIERSTREETPNRIALSYIRNEVAELF